jgi:hypothetical protein
VSREARNPRSDAADPWADFDHDAIREATASTIPAMIARSCERFAERIAIDESVDAEIDGGRRVMTYAALRA